MPLPFGRARRACHPITSPSGPEFWKLAARVGLPKFRRFRRPLSVAQIDAEIGASEQWKALKQSLKPGDELWPFEFNRYSLSYRKGVVVMRGGEPVAGIVTALS
jgi:hypothetical protein